MSNLSDHSYNVEIDNSGISEKKSKFNGCFFVSIMTVGVVLLFIIAVTVLIFKTAKGSAATRIFSGSNQEIKDIQETVVADGDSDDKIVIISITGIIFGGDGISRQHSSSNKIIRQLRKAKQDPKVVAIILDMNTPGGGVTATDEIHHELQKVRESGIKILTCMRTMAASGGYYLAAGTDYVIANRLTLTGSIGVIIGGYNYADLFQKIGLQSEIYKSGKFKDILNMARTREESEARLIQDLVDETYAEFAEVVATGRNLTLDEVTSSPIGDARIFSGRQAQKLGLVDALGYLEDTIEAAIEMANTESPTIIRYAPKYSITDLLFSFAADSISQALPGKPGFIQKGTLYYLSPLAL